MASKLVENRDTQAFLDKIAGIGSSGGNERVKQIVRRIVGDLFATIDEFDVTEDEFWAALNFTAAGAPEIGLWAAGLGFEHFLDVRMDIADQKAGLSGGTPRTIEGPLYIKGAPRTKGFARLDDGTDKGETLIMHGRVLDNEGKPVAGAIVDVWHANTLGNYSYFDKSQSDFNFRRQIETDTDGRYKFQSIVPSGYAVPSGGSTDGLLNLLGRHGQRPAHIHFFVTAPNHRHLTTQINIDGDPFLHDDFAYATRDELIPPVLRRTDPDLLAAAGVEGPYTEIEFDFTINRVEEPMLAMASSRNRLVA
ncbi:catechol 1,2-dioxygenase [Ensifer adhaerens]|uniref:catechol 1,2-dioxygenase n=1 Tax=Ensifer canadensis TaxID=555315 RepID=UPI0014901465|nr:catechol 1,2-dioxygenase [Ensifer canadensis]NOV20416.1 catechol 1,2-dioxygenase [Ensifer canadensis]